MLKKICVCEALMLVSAILNAHDGLKRISTLVVLAIKRKDECLSMQGQLQNKKELNKLDLA